jgi:hypothetical protein
MTAAEIKAEMRLWALECLVCQIAASFLKALPAGGAEMALKALSEGAKRNAEGIS